MNEIKKQRLIKEAKGCLDKIDALLSSVDTRLAKQKKAA